MTDNTNTNTNTIEERYADAPIVKIDSKEYYDTEIKEWLKSINETEEALDKEKTTYDELVDELEKWDEKQ